MGLARAKSDALVNNTYKQKTYINRGMLNGDGRSIDLISQKTNLHMQHAFCLSLPLFCTTLMPFCTTKTSNFLVTHYFLEEMSYVLTKDFVSCVRSRLPVFMFAFIFSLPLIFTWQLSFLIFSPQLSNF